MEQFNAEYKGISGVATKVEKYNIWEFSPTEQPQVTFVLKIDNPNLIIGGDKEVQPTRTDFVNMVCGY